MSVDDAHKDSATLTAIEQTEYERHLSAINACLQSGGGRAMSGQDLAAARQALRRERRLRGEAEEIQPIAYGRICANYTSGTLESEQVRRCRYQLGIYPITALKYCIQDARESAAIIKKQVRHACQKAKDAAEKLSENLIKERRLKMIPNYLQLEGQECGG